MKTINVFLVALVVILSTNNLYGQNPIIHNLYSADPTARVFNGKIYLYPSHDIQAPKDKDARVKWFCMEDYHVFSSANLVDWIDHGVIVSQDKVDWVKPNYNMWAPDCVAKNGKYYFFFPAMAKDTVYGKSFTVGVAVGDNPEGPFVPMSNPIKGVQGIDPNVFIDKDGQAYLYWSGRQFMCAKLNENMTELASEPIALDGFPQKGLKEGPFLFERNGIYYMTYPHVQTRIERLEYATSTSPMGPFTFGGVLMDETPTNCWTNHQSVVQYNNQWYLFYHNNDWSPRFDKNRAVCVDSLFFQADGSIRKVVPTKRGVGITEATAKIQIDRFSRASETGVKIQYNDTLNYFDGWNVQLSSANSWIQYN